MIFLINKEPKPKVDTGRGTDSKVNQSKKSTKARPQTAKPKESTKKTATKKAKPKTILKFRSTKATQLRSQAVRGGSPKPAKQELDRSPKGNQSVRVETKTKVVTRPVTSKKEQRKSRSPGGFNHSSALNKSKKGKSVKDLKKEQHLKRVMEASKRLYQGSSTVVESKPTPAVHKKNKTMSASREIKRTTLTKLVENKPKVSLSS